MFFQYEYDGLSKRCIWFHIYQNKHIVDDFVH